jgi:hypothetical protein
MTLLSSPTRSAKAATAIASKSPTKNNGHNNNKLSAAADLIRNLDAALLEMTNSAAKSADDAARARRNARTAAEVSAQEMSGISYIMSISLCVIHIITMI